jgi:predicted RNA-binding protein YlxR (DUF448 family)
LDGKGFVPELIKKPKKVPMRMCVACQTMRPKKELVRIVARTDGTVAVDPTGRMAGRGAYLCRNGTCLAKAIKERRMERALKNAVPRDLLDGLAQAFEGAKDGT